jgi:type III restriction enzyme
MLASLGTPEDEYRQAREAWRGLYGRRGDLLETRCGELTSLSRGTIRATLLRGQGITQAKERLTANLAGTRIRTKKVEDLCDALSATDDVVGEWQRVIDELEQLADIELEEGMEPNLPETPLLSSAGFTREDLIKLAQKLTVEEWLDLALTELGDIPSFEYQQREDLYIPFANASAGQQATALMRVLLNQSGPPLIIDQPEEDLDNQVILEIVASIWEAKSKRQLIFASHNANVVVNGDADLVVCCDYRRSSDQSGGRIKCQGAIDVEEIRSEITTVMEGGREAFVLRQAKYGF